MTASATGHERMWPDSDRQQVLEALAKSSVLHRQTASLGGELGVVDKPSHPMEDDRGLCRRIIAAFAVSNRPLIETTGDIWLTTINGMQSTELTIMNSGDVNAVAQMFRDPAQTEVFLGFDDLVAVNPYAPHHSHQDFRTWMLRWSYDTLLCLAEAVGTMRVENVEAAHSRSPVDVEEILIGLDEAFGFRIDFPNPFPHDVGLQTSRGIATFRAIQSLFQAWRLNTLLGNGGRSVIEVGGGLGRTAYYAFRFGIRDYTIVDLPLARASQSYSLGRTLGERTIHLFGEPSNPEASISIIPPEAFMSGGRRYDIAASFDSFTEMNGQYVASYFSAIKASSPVLLSINHEHNAITVRYFIDTTEGASSTRTPYWMRRGYVEEIVTFEPARHLGLSDELKRRHPKTRRLAALRGRLPLLLRRCRGFDGIVALAR